MPAKKKSQAAPTVKKISATRIAFRLRERYFSHEYINILGDASMREEYGVPKDVLAAYVVKLTIFRPSAPLAAIRAGAVPFDEAKKWTTTVPGANWAGHTKRMNTKRGPRNIKIGASEPDKTARTRAYHKAVINAFGHEFMDEQAIRQAQQIIEAEWEYGDGTTTAADDEVITGDGGAAGGR